MNNLPKLALFIRQPWACALGFFDWRANLEVQ